jgi:DNA (cytosine-5)-methyltransferase 1
MGTAPAPTDEKGRLAPAFVEWMMGAPDGWTEGVSRTQQLKMLGNGVQVQVGTLLGEALRGLNVW